MAQQRGPKALVVSPRFDMGFMPQKCRVAHAFWMYNLGTDSLRINKINVTCGCTKAPLQKMTIAPGDSAPIELIFEAGTRKKAQHKTATVSTNDPVNGGVELLFTSYIHEEGETTGPITITSNEHLRVTPADKGKTYPVVFKNVSDKSLTAKLVLAPTEFISVESPSGAIAPGATGEIKVTISPTLKQKNFSKSFTFELNDVSMTRYTVPVRMAESISALKAGEKEGS